MIKDDIIEIMSKIHLWHFSAFLSVGLLTLGFTGRGLLGDSELEDGMEKYAIAGGAILFFMTILIKYIPPKE
jgi:hypothetical protein